MEATDLLNRQDKKKTTTKYNSRGYLNDLDQTDPMIKYREESFFLPEPPTLKKAISANDQFKSSRATSFANYTNPRKVQSYMYYNYNNYNY